MSNKSGPVPDFKEKSDFLWKVIGRYDLYIGSTNVKANFIIAFNVFVSGLVVSNWDKLLQLFNGHDIAKCLATLCLLIIVGAAITSLGFIFTVVSPFLDSNKKIGNYQSSIFFGDVSEYENEGAYKERVLNESRDDHLQDLAHQVYVLSRGTLSKFKNLKNAVRAIVFCQLPACACLALMKVIIVFIELAPKVSN